MLLFFCYFQNSLFWKFDYSLSWCGFLWIHLIRILWTSGSKHTFPTSDLESFQPKFFSCISFLVHSLFSFWDSYNEYIDPLNIVLLSPLNFLHFFSFFFLLWIISNELSSSLLILSSAWFSLTLNLSGEFFS